MDSDNPIVKLCAEGMKAEAEGRKDDAYALFRQAWTESRDDYEACVAAHYVARQQKRPEERLRWNREALERADSVGDDRVRGFFPSLYLNLGHCHEMLGNLVEARRYFDLAAERIGVLPSGRYRDMVENGIAEGRRRLGSGKD